MSTTGPLRRASSSDHTDETPDGSEIAGAFVPEAAFLDEREGIVCRFCSVFRWSGRCWCYAFGGPS